MSDKGDESCGKYEYRSETDGLKTRKPLDRIVVEEVLRWDCM